MKNKFLKTLFLFVLTFSLYNTSAQPLVSISDATISISPSYTLNHGSPFTITGSVKNAGTTTIASNVHVHFAIDTSTTVGVYKFLTRVSNTYPQSNFLPNNTFAFSLADNADIANAYKTAGNGITVIIWASVGPNPNDSTTTKDSVYSHIYVLPPLQSISDEKAFEENSIVIENPAIEILNFKFKILNEPTTIDLIDENGSLLYHETAEPFIQHLTFNISHLREGIYYLRFTNQQTHKILTKKIIILN